ncbi:MULTISPECIES: thioredoxin family protein [Cyanophyceae]|uniref:thioredoxin family protein n=1 Tax=Cyanophyceae TaxID=3028117 RepID=UPI00016DCB7B|nr:MULTISPECIES: thioredoxin family protein [Cyanophyceae]ACA99379.1 Peroxiredoxin [Picosynechococcus sp. PCC 7002]ANV90392.1 alkyl hydroperoxide reductase [Picosynechococcus sp. PCC 8807]SMH31833.1 Peroxiredoxin [Picosynechococcus sp. OG1]SMQ84122.1 Peroxiredoxin [Synechococcus sp. 7002]
MARTESTMLPLGAPAPDFALPDVTTGKTVSLGDFRGKAGLLVIFMCRHCPFVIHVQDELARLGVDFVPQDLGIVAISANDAENYPDDGPEKLKEMAAALQLNFPILYDESQAIAKSYQAACTPDFFLFDQDLKLVYRGQLDDARPGNDKPVTGADLRQAIAAVLAKETPDPNQKPSLGCNIKWKPGNAPSYFG